MKISTIIIFFVLFLIAAYFFLQDDPVPTTPISSKEIETTVISGKTSPKDPGVEIAEKVIEEFPEFYQNVKEAKKTKDSIIQANREKRYALQIGFPVTSEKEVLRLYKTIIAKSPEGIKIFKKSRKDFILVKYDGSSEQELKKSLRGLRNTLGEKNIHIVDLMDFCNKRERIKEDKQKIYKEEIPCLICD